VEVTEDTITLLFRQQQVLVRTGATETGSHGEDTTRAVMLKDSLTMDSRSTRHSLTV
jgi:hypothetical protein